MKYKYDSRKNRASQMKRKEIFFSVSHFATTLLTVNCQLSTVNWIHTFSAKEKDTETGLSYFGSRYYNSDLSIWLSVDPMSDKYPSLSPYAYCANNPVKLVDPNGEEINPIFNKAGKYVGRTTDEPDNHSAIIMDDYSEKKYPHGITVGQATSKEVGGVFLNKYKEGINISDEEWDKAVANGGERMFPFVENHSNETIFFKPEEDSKVSSIKPGKDLYAPVDGIAAPHLHKGMVYKITDGVHVTVTNNGVNISKVSGLKNKLAMIVLGGWKDESWHSSLTTDRFLIYNCNDQPPYYMYKTPDHGWDDLFSKSK